MTSNETRNVLLLAACQALFWGALMIGITMSGLVGQILAPHPALATLPAGIAAVIMVAAMRPASVMMQRLGRRSGFLAGAIAGVAGGLLSAAGIFVGDFVLFCIGNGVIGIYQAIGQFYRLAATDSVPPARRGRAVSTVLTGGIVAALAAPTLTVWSKELFAPVAFAGSFLAVSVLSLVAVALIAALAETRTDAAPSRSGGRPLGEILRQPIFIAAIANAGVSQGVMVLVMLATPIAMVACGFPVSDAAWVIQWHVLGMFVPSFFSGRLVDRFGAGNVGLVGALVLSASAVVAATGIDLTHFGVALTLLGIGWNLMYVAGSTMITAAHRPEERGRVQGAAETSIAVISAIASFASAALLNGLGWEAVNIGALPLLIVAGGVAFLAARRQATAATVGA